MEVRHTAATKKFSRPERQLLFPFSPPAAEGKVSSSGTMRLLPGSISSRAVRRSNPEPVLNKPQRCCNLLSAHTCVGSPLLWQRRPRRWKQDVIVINHIIIIKHMCFHIKFLLLLSLKEVQLLSRAACLTSRSRAQRRSWQGRGCNYRKDCRRG